MCSAPKPPDPVAPPAPVSMLDTRRDTRERERSAQQRRSLGANATTTQLTGAGGDTSQATTASPVLGV